MLPERYPPDDPREWLNRARSNLARAQNRAQGIYLEDLCFDAQQAAEKALKGLLLHLGATFPYVHDIGLLVGLIEQQGVEIPLGVRKSARLTRFATLARYPSAAKVSEAEHREALDLAQAAVEWVAARLAGERAKGSPEGT